MQLAPKVARSLAGRLFGSSVLWLCNFDVNILMAELWLMATGASGMSRPDDNDCCTVHFAPLAIWFMWQIVKFCPPPSLWHHPLIWILNFVAFQHFFFFLHLHMTDSMLNLNSRVFWFCISYKNNNNYSVDDNIIAQSVAPPFSVAFRSMQMTQFRESVAWSLHKCIWPIADV